MAKRTFTQLDITQNDSFTEALSNSVVNQPEIVNKKKEGENTKVEENKENQETSQNSDAIANTPVISEEENNVVEPAQVDAVTEKKGKGEDKGRKKKMEFLRILTERNHEWHDMKTVRISRENIDELKSVAQKLGQNRNVCILANNIILNFLKEYRDIIDAIKESEEKKEVAPSPKELREKRLNELYEKIR